MPAHSSPHPPLLGASPITTATRSTTSFGPATYVVSPQPCSTRAPSLRRAGAWGRGGGRLEGSGRGLGLDGGRPVLAARRRPRPPPDRRGDRARVPRAGQVRAAQTQGRAHSP